MRNLFFAALGLQGAFLLLDEFYFHRRRGLPTWERRGHPIDTLFFLLALGGVWLFGSSIATIILAILSTVIITKDEWVHADRCSPTEMWLHSVLFILHPVVLFLAHQSAGTWGAEILILLFSLLAYQTLYWNIYAQPPLEN